MVQKKVAIIQSNYIPWKGYFDIINSVDEFILFDDVQYTRRDWRNRNLIKTPKGLFWLTIPVNVKNNYFIPINQVEIADSKWGKTHWATLAAVYSKTKYFKAYREYFEPLYLNHQTNNLSQLNLLFINTINAVLGIRTKISWSTDYELAEGKSQKLANLCKQSGATIYLSGPAASDYLEEQVFEELNIKVQWMNYSGYPIYSQLYPPFEHGVSILDLIFNEGPDASKFMKSFA
jgi:hypothetical protein